MPPKKDYTISGKINDKNDKASIINDVSKKCGERYKNKYNFVFEQNDKIWCGYYNNYNGFSSSNKFNINNGDVHVYKYIGPISCKFNSSNVPIKYDPKSICGKTDSKKINLECI